MKGILTTAILLALTLPGLAQESQGVVSASQQSSLHQKGYQLSPTLQSRIRFDRGVLLRDPGLGAFKNPTTQIINKGIPANGVRCRLDGKGGFQLNDSGNLRWGVGVRQYQRPQIRIQGGAIGGALNNRSTFFRGDGRKSAFLGAKPHVPGVDSHVREELTYHFAWLGGAAGLQVKDPIAKDSWSLRMACRPKVKKESDNRYTAQVACYGRLGWSQQQLPVVVQFTLLGSEKKWKVHGQPVIVSANRITRPGRSVMANLWAEEMPPSAVDNAVQTVSE